MSKFRARVSGHIQKIGFQDGDLVSKGQMLFQLDPRPFQAQVDQALAQAKALAAQQNSLDSDVARYTELVKTKAVTQQQLEQTIARRGLRGRSKRRQTGGSQSSSA